MGFHLVNEDITEMNVDAIVNAANNDLFPGGGVCGAIYDAAGFSKLYEACMKIGHVDTGKAVITPGFELKARYIIHTAGPVYIDGKHNEAELLKSCYKESLKLALDNHVTSIAFPLISAGIYGYPKGEAYDIACQAIREFLDSNDMDVYLTIIDNYFLIERYKDECSKIISEINKAKQQDYSFENEPNSNAFGFITIKPHKAKSKIEEAISNVNDTFSEYLLKLIDRSGMTDVEVYKKAEIDRKLFSKIRSDKNYRPAKKTVLYFCLALKLNIDDTKDLLNKAGYSLSDSIKEDVAFEYFIENKEYDIYKIKDVFCALGLKDF